MTLLTNSLNGACIVLVLAAGWFLVGNYRLENDIFKLRGESWGLKKTLDEVHKTCKHEVVSAFPRISPTHIISHEREELAGLDIERNVTFILGYNAENEAQSSKYLQRQIKAITSSFPTAKSVYFVYGAQSLIKRLSKELPPTMPTGFKMAGVFLTEAEGLNTAIINATTPYFLVLQPDKVFEPRDADGGIEWLHHAMVITSGFDIIGGSTLLSNNELVIPCYSINLCNWTLVQNYEYRRSFGEVMICDEVSYSFMARTDIVKTFNNDLFDKSIDRRYLYTDFFLRAKNLGLTVANRPEVMFLQDASYSEVTLTATLIMDRAITFAKKHQVLRFKDQAKQVTSICQSSNRNLCTVQHMVENWQLPQWYNSGMFAYPFAIEQAIETLEKITNELKESSVMFALRGETLFGAMMTKSILPWGKLEAIQLWAFASIDELKKFADNGNYKITIRDNKLVTLMVGVPSFPSPMKVEFEQTEKKTDFANIKVNGKLYQIMEDPSVELKELYGENYLGGPDSKNQGFSGCKVKGHHACLPEMQTRGANTYKEVYCVI